MSDVSTTSVVSVPTLSGVTDLLTGSDTFDAGMSAFAGLSAKDRNTVRRTVEARMFAFMDDGDLEGALSVKSVFNAIKTVTPVKSEIDVKSVVAEKVAIYRFAANYLMGAFVHNGVTVELDETDIPLMSDELAEKAAKFLNVTIGTKTKENDIPALVAEAFDSVETGTFLKVSAIRNAIARNHPNKGVSATWDGRINAALFPKNSDGVIVASNVPGVEGVRPGHPSYTDKNGGVKV